MTKTEPDGKVCPFCGKPVYQRVEYISTTQKGTKKVIFAHRKCVYKGKETKP